MVCWTKTAPIVGFQTHFVHSLIHSFIHSFIQPATRDRNSVAALYGVIRCGNIRNRTGIR